MSLGTEGSVCYPKFHIKRDTVLLYLHNIYYEREMEFLRESYQLSLKSCTSEASLLVNSMYLLIKTLLHNEVAKMVFSY